MVSTLAKRNSTGDIGASLEEYPSASFKPAARNSGLGLSITHDIVKAHGGELKVESVESESLPGDKQGTAFIINLPKT